MGYVQIVYYAAIYAHLCPENYANCCCSFLCQKWVKLGTKIILHVFFFQICCQFCIANDFFFLKRKEALERGQDLLDILYGAHFQNVGSLFYFILFLFEHFKITKGKIGGT